MIVYLAKFKHKETGKEFHKFGITKNTFEERFDPKRHYPDRIGYEEFDIKCINQIECNYEQAKKIESYFKKIRPKNFYLEYYLNKPFNYYRGKFPGITEIVILDDIEIINKYFDEIKDFLNQDIL